MADIPQAAWDALAQPLKTPFLEWEWLNNLEISGSAAARTGWQPCHLTIWKGQELVAAAPFYVKGHSYGEFVFDHQWANLAARLGIEYYPKLLGMTPFTPAEGYRFLMAPGEDEFTLTEIMVSQIDHFCDRNGLSGCNYLFVDPQWRKTMENYGFTSWLHHSYIWQNQGFSGFDDYLKMFNANQRRNIKRERKSVEQAGLTIKTLAGEEIPHHLFPLIYRFYSSTCDKFYWGSKYLTRQFFENLYPNYQHRVVLVAAFSENNPDHPVGLSFCLRKDENLYGRYWGCTRDVPFLHFELCYYQAIDYAIAHGLPRVEAGAQGEHKLARGYEAVPTYSAHYIANAGFRSAVADFLARESQAMERQIEFLGEMAPFKKG
jgi:predicted N-acyltransferase